MAMRFVTGYNNRDGEKVKYKRKIRRAELRDGTVRLCPLRTGYDEIVIETSSVGVRMERLMFDVHIRESKMSSC